MRRLLLFLVIALAVSSLQAQTDPLAATVTVIADGVYVQLAGAVNELPLPVGAVAPLGAGDQVRTADNGRAFLNFPSPDTNTLLLLPDSTYQLREFTDLGNGQYQLESSLRGIAIQQFVGDASDWDYALITDAFTVVEPSGLFAVWAVGDRLEAAITAQGALSVETDAADTPINVPQDSGLFAPYNEVRALDAPLHASQLLALSINCRGVVSTNSTDELRLRAGNALDYPILEGLQNNQEVYLVGTSDNGLWYRIPYQTGFGWLYSGYIRADCPNLPEFPRLVDERNEQITNVTDAELPLLTPFYGTPLTNLVFYRY